jgi:hypothetical protein
MRVNDCDKVLMKELVSTGRLRCASYAANGLSPT